MAFRNGQQNLMEALLRFQDPNAPGFVAPGGYDVSGQTETPTIDPNAIDPVALGIEARKLQRDQGLAEAMMSQGYTPNSGPLGILAPVLGAVLGSKMQRQGDEKLSDLVGKYGQYRQQADAVKFAREQQQEKDKADRELKQAIAKARAEAEAKRDFAGPQELSPGTVLRDPKTGQVLFSAPFAPREAPHNADLESFNAYLRMPPEQRALYDQQHGRDMGAGKTPAGYREGPGGTLQAIPGGPADLKQQGALNQDTSALQSGFASMDRLAEAANGVLKHPGLKGITGVRGMVPNLPGTDAADAEAQLNSLKSQVAFGVLQEMRNNSKTGGALGSVSDAEGKRLEANLAALEKAQSYDQFKEQLGKIVNYSNSAKDRLLNAYNLKHKNVPDVAPGSSELASPQGGPKRLKYNQATGDFE